jgi:N6-adenosine-specific RNA methylase IME4
MFSPMAQAPTKKYRTIVADPPWRYDVKPPEGGTPYPTMTPEELAGLPVGMWANEDSHLYLWTTNSFLVEAHRIMAAWGFEYKTLLTWIKRKRPPNVDNWIGMGFYYRGVTEHVLFGVRGSLHLKRNNAPNVFYAPHGQHSEKPAAFYDLVESASHGPYLDVFARANRFNWDTFGDEAFNFGTTQPPEAFAPAPRRRDGQGAQEAR